MLFCQLSLPDSTSNVLGSDSIPVYPLFIVVRHKLFTCLANSPPTVVVGFLVAFVAEAKPIAHFKLEFWKVSFLLNVMGLKVPSFTANLAGSVVPVKNSSFPCIKLWRSDNFSLVFSASMGPTVF